MNVNAIANTNAQRHALTAPMPPTQTFARQAEANGIEFSELLPQLNSGDLILYTTNRFSAAMTTSFDERKPKQTAPCLTASIAYSIWWMRPCGDHSCTSVSYSLRYILPEKSAAPKSRAQQHTAL